jgi:hypothetical protein
MEFVLLASAYRPRRPRREGREVMSTRDCVCFQDFCAEIEVLQDEVARLREALKPFAYAADDLDRENWGSGSIEGSLAHITAEDCRSARAASQRMRRSNERR